MSKKIYKKPYIETVLESLTAEEITALKTIINSDFQSGTPVVVLNDSNFKCKKDRWSNANIASIQIQNAGITAPGIIIYTSTYKVFLRPQSLVSGPFEVWDLTITDDVLTGYVKKTDSVDVEELRRIVGIKSVSTSGDISSKLDKTGLTKAVPEDESYEFTYSLLDTIEGTPTAGVLFNIVYSENNKELSMSAGEDGSSAVCSVAPEAVTLGVDKGEDSQVLQVTKNDATLAVMGTSTTSIATKGYVDTHGSVTHLYKHSVVIENIQGSAESSSLSGVLMFEFYSSNSTPITSFYDLTNHGFVNNSSKIISSNNFANTNGTTVLYITFNFTTSSARGSLSVVYADYGSTSNRTIIYAITSTGYNDTVVQII